MLTRQRLQVNGIHFAGVLGLVRWLPSVLWMSFLFYLSHQPAPLEPVASEVDPFFAHVAVYSILALLLHFALADSNGATPRWVPISLAFALAMLYGVGDEIHQAYVPGRVASELDLVADAIGAAIGVGVMGLAAFRISLRAADT